MKSTLSAAFYRVNYDMKNWVMLKRAFESGNLPRTTRAQLLDDALFFGRKGILDYTFVMDMTKILGYYIETEYTVWKPLLRHLNYIRNILIMQEGSTENDPEPSILNPFKVPNIQHVLYQSQNIHHFYTEFDAQMG